MNNSDSQPIYSLQTQSLGFETIINIRELGGYRMPDGRTVKHGLLLRGGALSNTSHKELMLLHDQYHLACVFDFRTSYEVERNPDRPVSEAKYIWLPAFDENSMTMGKMALPPSAYKDLGGWLVEHAHKPEVQEVARNMYPIMVTTEFTQVQYAGFFQNILNSEEGAIYWHCSQGKDRTGLGSALILAALGADRNLIMQDFEISNEYYKNDVDAIFQRVKTDEEREAILTFVGVNPHYFANALDIVEHQYGSLIDFLKGPICLSDDDIEQLRNRFLE